jgi:peptidoglycan hydrolase-like protein with peptidoglycan-binding domain
MIMRRLPLLLLLASCTAAPILAQSGAPAPAKPAQAPPPFVGTTAEEAVTQLATHLEANFVFPDKGKAYAAMLRANLASGKYSSFPDAVAFARAVTDDLQAVHKDRHLAVRVVPPEMRAMLQAGAGAPPSRRGGGPERSAVSKSGWIADGVAYISFDGFPGNEATAAAVRAFLDAHGSAKTLIVDARHHRGGGLDEMDLLFSELYDKPVVLVGMDTRIAVEQRRGSPIAGHPTLRETKGPEGVVRREHVVAPAAQPRLANAKVYLLTSNKTGSAGEHFSLALKRTGRATLVGETTAGAGHYGGIEPLDKAFTYAAFIPVGRTFDPDTGEGWEGTGVKPHVPTAADKALDEALKLAGVDPAAATAKLASLK